MLDDANFISGVWCGVIFGAAGVMLIVSLIFESSHRKQERLLRRAREMWR
jgi:hypothetical protein